MRVRVVDAYDELSREAADLLAGAVARRPEARLGLTTGKTPLGAYRELSGLVAGGRVELGRALIFHLDEYLGVGPDHPQSLFGWLRRACLGPCRIAPDRVIRLEGDSPHPEVACAAFEDALDRAGGLDLLVISIGRNGHLGFNEPGSAPDSRTRVVALTQDTIAANAEYWGTPDLVPRRALTAGVATLLAARQILLLVSGPDKAHVLARALEGAVTPALPASYLQTVGRRLTVLVDRAAGRHLQRLVS